MIGLVALRNLTLKPWRSVFLLFGFSMGVAVMIVLLSIGEALLSQAKDEKLVGGGSITVLPEGVDVEVLKTWEFTPNQCAVTLATAYGLRGWNGVPSPCGVSNTP